MALYGLCKLPQNRARAAINRSSPVVDVLGPPRQLLQGAPGPVTDPRHRGVASCGNAHTIMQPFVLNWISQRPTNCQWKQ
ncbi:hypothetical protein ACP4OV_005666 [Aristida adscensionis]